MKKLAIWFAVLVSALAFGLFLVACGGDDDDGDGEDVHADFGQPGYKFQDAEVEVDLTASVFDWEVVPGETVEVWGYNEQYPGPQVRVTEGQRVRVNLHNNLPEATTIHFHGLDVPNDQDGVPGITQPAVEPGETWTYEFVAERVGTTVYHTHANTASQLAKGLFGFLIVEPQGGLDYDREYALGLHEIDGLYTINGHSFPATLDENVLLINEGERILIRLANMGSVHHPMHMHGHQFEVVNIDGNRMPEGWRQNTVDVAPGQTVDLVIEGTNPGTWTFHCHIVPHVTNRGEYPGGMLTVLDYEDHTSYFEQQQAAGGGSEAPDAAAPTGSAPAGSAREAVLGEWSVLLGGGDEGTVAAGDVSIDARNVGTTIHELVVIKTDDAPGDLPIGDASSVDEEAAGTVIGRTEILAAGEEGSLRLGLEPGNYVLICNVPTHYDLGMYARLVVQ